MKYLLIGLFLLTGCFGMSTVTRPAMPALPTPATSVVEPLAENATDAQRAVHFRDLADRYNNEAKSAQKRADAERLAARQQWFTVIGSFAIGLGFVAFILSFYYPLGGTLRVGGTVAVAVGIASILLGEILPYLWIVAVVALVAIVVSLVVNGRVTRIAVGSWKATAQRLPESEKAIADRASLTLQSGQFAVKKYIDTLLQKV